MKVFDDKVPEGYCEICGEQLPEGERMFRFHGHSMPCPKGPRAKPSRVGIAEYVRWKDSEGFYLQIKFNGDHINTLGPFDTQSECDAAAEDLLAMMRQLGARDGSAAEN